ncbi:hypothetical protein F2Q70_00014759 [Brassica cretica]|uniref:Uncharacterized protein n=1 Tax=Brassica cretica TaxID=69181 RepID=A0A8S9HUS5_BRACR|nr:hypothetical protein F2Q70_00014759 [Brassica cretica]
MGQGVCAKIQHASQHRDLANSIRSHRDPRCSWIDTDVFETLNAMGISPLCYQTHELYPDLVRQALAIAHIGYDNPQTPTYENCSFSFMADGKFCSLSLDQFNEIYEISDERKDVAVENKFTPTERFWDLIATGSGSFASIKAYQSQIRNPTLRMRSAGRELESHFSMCRPTLASISSGCSTHGKTSYSRPTTITIDVAACSLRCSNTSGSTSNPTRSTTTLKFLCADPRAPPPDDDMDELEDITPNEETAYDLGPLDDDADEEAYHRWMIDSQRKNNSLMKRILKAITGGCFGGQEPRPSAAEQTPQQSHRAGKKPAGSSAGAERLPRNRRTAGRSESGESD